MWAIDSILGKLKYFKRPPPNGVVFFVGHKSSGGDLSEPVSYVIEPPEPISTFMYRCDSFFYLQPLEEMSAEKDTYGLLVIDRKEATLGLLRGKRIIPVVNKQSFVPSKHGRGGQSQRRFERLIEIAAHEFYVKVGDMMKDAFLNQKELCGILVGGPGATKEYFITECYLHHELQKKVLTPLIDTGYTDEYGLRELVEKASETLSNLELMREKKLVQQLMDAIYRSEGLATYGEDEVRRLLDLGAVDTLLISEGLRKERSSLRCSSCGYMEAKTVSVEMEDDANPEIPCSKCGQTMTEEKREDIVKELFSKAAASKSHVAFISTDSSEGEMFMRAFGGLAALLRYRER
jgi:peptide chain release factor subunit 1